MKRYIKVKNISGGLICILLCLTIWYKEYLQFAYGKVGGTFQIMGIALILITVIDFCIFFKKKVLYRIPNAAYRMTVYIVATFILGMVVSPVINQHIVSGISYIEYCVIMLVICYYAVTRGNVEFLIINFCILGVVLCFTFLRNPIPFNQVGIVRYTVFSKNVNPNTLAMNLVMGSWSALYLSMKKRCFFPPALLVTVICTYACFLTGSKKSVLYMALCVVLWGTLCYIPLDNRKSVLKQLVKIAVGLFGIAVVFSYLLPLFQGSAVYERLLNAYSDESTIERFSMYREGIKYLCSSPLFGYGFWGFQSLFGTAYSHSNYVEVFVSGGIPLGLLYFSSYVSICKTMKKRGEIYALTNTYLGNVEIRMAFILLIILAVGALGTVQIYDLTSYYYYGIVISLCFYNKKR